MIANFELLKQTRKNFLEAISGLSIQELNIVPNGFNNNIIWNFGHVIVTQQVLCYKMSGQGLLVDMDLVSKYTKGSRPQGLISEEEFNKLKSLAFPLLEALENDYKSNKFENYTEYTTSYGAVLSNIAKAVEFVTLHEALHYGYVMALKRAISMGV